MKIIWNKQMKWWELWQSAHDVMTFHTFKELLAYKRSL